MKQLQAHEEAIRSQVCTECLSPSGSGMCGSGNSRECPLNRLLPRAVEAVRSGRSTTIVEFLLSLKPSSGLSNGSKDTIISPDEAEWLKRSFPLIKNAVEEADVRLVRANSGQLKSGVDPARRRQ